MAKKKIDPDTDALSQNDIDALLGLDDDDGAEMNQSAIDALLGGGVDAEDSGPVETAGTSDAEMDQSAIDALLGNDDSQTPNSPPPPAQQAVAPGGEMDQSLIDALLGGEDNVVESAPAPTFSLAETADASGEEMDQSAIDALLGNDNSDESTPAPTFTLAETAAASSAEMAPNAIGALLGNDNAKTPPEQQTAAPGGELDQNLIDALLGGGIDAEDSSTTPPLAPAETAEASGEEMDQNAIDALLGNDATEAPRAEPPPPQQTATPDGELDQSDIDALLGTGMEAKPQKKKQPPPPQKADNLGEELDQSDIDALLGAGMGSPAPPPKQPAPARSADALGAEMDQSDIEALLGGGDTDHTQIPPQAGDFGELDQATIDALMGGGDSETITPAPAADNKDEDFGELDQATIDALMGGGEEASVSETTSRSELKKEPEKPGTPEQDEIDQLFSGGDESPDYTLDAFSSEGEDEIFKEIFDRTADTDSSAVSGGTNTDTGDETLGFEEELFADDEKTIAEPANLAAEKDIFSSDEAPAADQAGTDKPRKKGKKSFFPFLHAKGGKVMKTAAAISLAGVLGVTAYFFLFGQQGSQTTVPPLPQITQQPPAVVTPEQPAPAPIITPNHPPLIADGKYYLSQAKTTLPILLAGQDDDNDTLEFEIITAPKHGELSGKPPELTYTPGKDFPEEDLFEYRASDGRDFSDPAKVTIARDEPAPAPVVIAPKAPPSRNMVRAEDVTLQTTSTKELEIDWREIWEKFNHIPFSRVVQVEVVKKTLHGQLHRLSASKYQYQPDPYFTGEDELEYRFKLGAASSKKKRLRLLVKMGNPRPEIKLAALAPSYKVGAPVLLDASQTRDNERQSLTFTWELVSGVPVQMEFRNREGSRASFVMPSTFRSTPNLIIRVTAIDPQGLSDSKDITIATIHQPAEETALWQGQPGPGFEADNGLDRYPDGLRQYGD